jgi:cytochrome c oxidase cbb3-type subunit 3
VRAVLASLVSLVVACGSSSSAPNPPPPPPVAVPDAGAAVVTDPRIARGGAAFVKYCALCHGEAAQGYVADHAPSLRSPTFLESADDTFLARSIALGRPSTPMAAYAKELGGPLSDADIADMIAWIRHGGPTHRPPPPSTGKGDAAAGAALYATTCQSCHGDRATRLTAVQLGHPVFLALASDAFIRDAIVRGRPGTPMEAYGGKLTATQIDDLVAHLRSWAEKPTTAPPPPVAPPADGPVVINPRGKAPQWKLKDGRFVAAADVKAAYVGKRKMVIVDARPPSDWLTLRIPGAISIPHYDVSTLDRIPNDGTWVVAYCACPHHASGVIVDELRKRGYKNTAVLDEGILFWHRQGYPVEGSNAALPPAADPHAGHKH